MSTSSDADSSSSTVAELTIELERDGYRGHFGVVDADEVRCFSCRTVAAATAVTVDQIVRTEGVSDPDDEAAIAAVTCPSCGSRGTLTLHYGPTADPNDAEVLRLL